MKRDSRRHFFVEGLRRSDEESALAWVRKLQNAGVLLPLRAPPVISVTVGMRTTKRTRARRA